MWRRATSEGAGIACEVAHRVVLGSARRAARRAPPRCRSPVGRRAFEARPAHRPTRPRQPCTWRVTRVSEIPTRSRCRGRASLKTRRTSRDRSRTWVIGRPTRVARSVRSSFAVQDDDSATDRGGATPGRDKSPLDAAEVSSHLISLRVSPVEGIAPRRPVTAILATGEAGARLSGSVKFPRQIEGPGTKE